MQPRDVTPTQQAERRARRIRQDHQRGRLAPATRAYEKGRVVIEVIQSGQTRAYGPTIREGRIVFPDDFEDRHALMDSDLVKLVNLHVHACVDGRTEPQPWYAEQLLDVGLLGDDTIYYFIHQEYLD